VDEAPRRRGFFWPFALAREKPVTEQDPGALQSATFHEGSTLRDEDVADEIRMVQEVEVLRSVGEVRNVAVVARQVLDLQFSILNSVEFS
jgi:hypothetical protein